MAEYVYPAIFHSNDDGTFTITYPDLPGCISEGKSLGNAISMAQSALTQWIEYLTDKKQPIPSASNLADIKIYKLNPCRYQRYSCCKADCQSS